MSGSGSGVPEDDALDDAVARLARSARQRNLGRADRVLELLAPSGASPSATPGATSGGAAPDPADRDEAALLCHSIVGSAGTFGDDELADAARHVESALQDGHRDGMPAALDRLRATASALRGL
ncbi:Hpt domain-containing protein [Isoptericola sp. CG 20/1183]|uniref:Hpt domain-containing protein n=1 Tax=Isoptericola halotolerans TaxID=300560 RepID=A0ABX5EGY3_9MICO|nr:MULTISPECIES: Hpt domain-containing protein [Isoptericola]PRZ08755.1 Hpt domain-containing protein [Isoptericola halotolerans]PRZ10798.1 Hpt domain-containing protein [Isoptericola sp. CG 20/1183]